MSESAERYQAEKTEWDRIAESRPFKGLMATKKTFIVPAFVFFNVYYFLLPVLVGYAPEFMATKVIGEVNLAYLFALSQFFMAGGTAVVPQDAERVSGGPDFSRAARRRNGAALAAAVCRLIPEDSSSLETRVARRSFAPSGLALD